MRDAEQTVAHRAAGHAGFEINVVRRGRVNGAVIRQRILNSTICFLAQLNRPEKLVAAALKLNARP